VIEQLPATWSVEQPQPTAKQQAAAAARRQRSIDTFVQAWQAFGAQAAQELEAFVNYRLEVAQAQLGGRRLKARDVAEYETAAQALATRLGPELVAAVQATPRAQWRGALAWSRAHQLDDRLPDVVQRLGKPAAEAINALLAEYGYGGGDVEAGAVSAYGVMAHNPLACGRWPAHRYVSIPLTQTWGELKSTIWVKETHPGPLSAPWAAVTRAARACDWQDDQ
jgi:hypothetical protein